MKTVSIILMTIYWSVLFGQSMVEVAGARFSESESQWLCAEIKKSNPTWFNCLSLGTAGPKIPNGRPSMNEERLGQFKELYFPDGECTRFLVMRSLCDLYFPLVERKLDQNQLPLEFKYLPLVVSAYNPGYCDGRDRCGIWGLDYLVARSIHLRVDSLIDERRGADFTTDAAVKYLSSLYRRFNSDKEKTLLAFYFSVPYVINRSDFAITDEARFFLDLYYFTVELFETNQADNQLSNYFDILGSYESMFFTSPIKYDALEAVLGVKKSDLHKTNPVYTGNSIDPAFRRVPFILEKQIATRFQTLKDSIYDWQPPVARDEWQEVQVIYKVKKGDSLGKIAEQNGVSVSQLRKWNKLRKDRIYAGQKLVIYKKKKVAAETPAQAAHSKTLTNLKPGQSETGIAPVDSVDAVSVRPSTSNQTETKDDTEVIQYRVKSGDSLWLISKKWNGVTPEKIMKWNNCSEDIKPGQILNIYPGK